MAGRLDGRVAFVTGCGSIGPGWGNGKAISAVFAREGASVFGIDRVLAAADETRAIVEGEGGRITVRAADVSSEADVAGAVEACLATYRRIDILVNNVGIVRLGRVTDMSVEDWNMVFAVNVTGAFLTAKYVLPIMERQGRGALVNIASIAAIRYTGVPYISYYTTKAAMLGMTRGIALEYAAKGIRANAVLPGLMDTPLVAKGLTAAYGTPGDVDALKRARRVQCPTGAMGDAFDVANACLYLASDEAKYVTGAELVVDGGITQKYA